MRRLKACCLAILFAVCAGCNLPGSLPEFVSDPLGIDRTVREHYFPNGVEAGRPTGQKLTRGEGVQ